MGVLDFLFEGSAPPSVTKYGTSTTNIPQWMSDYSQGLIGKANAIAAQPYQTYGGPRVAGLTDAQQQAASQVKGQVGSYLPGLQNATDTTNAAAAAPGALASATPYMQRAGQTMPGNLEAYLNPYTTNVIDRATQVANRNFNESTLPSIQNMFTGAGQYGSSNMQQVANKAGRDLTEGLQSNAGAMLSDAYNTAGSQFTSDQNRLAGLAGTSASAAASDRSSGLAAGQQQASLAGLKQQMGLADANALQAVGSQQQGLNQANLDTAYGDWQAQTQNPKENVNWLAGLVNGMPANTASTTTSTAPLAGAKYGSSGMDQVLGGLSAAKGIYDIFKARGGHVRHPIRFARGGLVYLAA